MSSTTVAKLARQFQRDYAIKYTSAVRLSEAALANLSNPVFAYRFEPGFSPGELLEDSPEYAGLLLYATDLPDWHTSGLSTFDFAIAWKSQILRFEVFEGTATPAERRDGFLRGLYEATIEEFVRWVIFWDPDAEPDAEPSMEVLEDYYSWYDQRLADDLGSDVPPEDFSVLDTFERCGLLARLGWVVDGASGPDDAVNATRRVAKVWESFNRATVSMMLPVTADDVEACGHTANGPVPEGGAFVGVTPDGFRSQYAATTMFWGDSPKATSTYLARLLGEVRYGASIAPTVRQFPFGLGVLGQTVKPLTREAVTIPVSMHNEVTHLVGRRYMLTHPADRSVDTLRTDYRLTHNIQATTAALAMVLCNHPDSIAGWTFAAELVAEEYFNYTYSNTDHDWHAEPLRIMGEQVLAVLELVTGIAATETQEVPVQVGGLGFFLPADSPVHQALHDTLTMLARFWVQKQAKQIESENTAPNDVNWHTPYTILHTMNTLGGTVPPDLLWWVEQQQDF